MKHNYKKIEQNKKLEAAQLLWFAVNELYNEGYPKAIRWFECKGVATARYCCRGVYTIAAFWDAREFVDNMAPDLWSDLEEFAKVFLKVCVTDKSMNVSREWKIRLARVIEEATK